MPESSRRHLLFWPGLLILYVLHAAVALREERVLWADGAHYVSQILTNRAFFLVDFSRATADLLLQLPLVSALEAGVADLAWLKFAFGLPSFVLVPLFMMLCIWMAGPSQASLSYPLATVAAGMMSTELLVIHESRVALALFWPVLFALLDPLGRLSTLVAGAFLSVPFIAAYESAIVLGPILAYAAFERLRRETAPSQRRAAATCLCSAFLATLVALESIIRPTHPQNLTQFWESSKGILEDGGASVHLSLIILVLALPWLQTQRRLRIITAALAGVACGVVVLQSLSDPIHVAVESQYRARILNVVLPAIASVALLFSRRFSLSAAPGRNVLGILFVAQVALQLQLTSQWSVFRQVTREELGCVRGLIPVDTAISRQLVERGVSREWMSGWHFPTLSLLDRAGPMNAVLGVADGGASWQPFDPRNLDGLPDLSRYGVDDREYREAMRRLLSSGGPTWETVSPCQGSRSPSPDSTPTANPNTK